MPNEPTTLLNPTQLRAFSAALHQAVQHASASLAQWIDRPASISIDAIDQLFLRDAAEVLGSDATPICFCTVKLQGRLSGEMMLAFDDRSGLALTDMLLHHPLGTATEWNELEQSAALETANIVCCAYLNELSRILPQVGHRPSELLPSPPRFRRDFAESVLQSAMVQQALAGDYLLVAQAAFQIDRAAINWNLLFVPDAATMADLAAEVTK